MPYTPPEPPLYSNVQDARDGVNAAREANEARERIAREIGQVAVQGTTQPR